MPDHKVKKRAAPISYRPPESLREEFTARVEQSGLSISAFITKAIFNTVPSRQSRRPALEEKLLAKLLHEAAQIHHDLQKIDVFDDDAVREQIGVAIDELTIIRAALLKAMGRQP